MDPLSITLAVVGLSKLCITAGGAIRQVVESMKRSRQSLLDLLSEVERVRLLLDSLRRLAHQLHMQGKSTYLLEFNEASCQKVVEDLQTFAEVLQRQNRSDLWRAIVWTRFEGKANALLSRLKKEKKHIDSVLNVTAAETAVDVGRRMSDLVLTISSQSVLIDSFESVTLVDSEDRPIENDIPKSAPTTTWFGRVLTDGHSSKYISSRFALSEAAYWGDWDDFHKALRAGKDGFNEHWINCTRMKPQNAAGGLTLWTPLHQAAYNKASIEEVQALIREGSLRTLRSRLADEFPHPNLTAVEIAQQLGYNHLYGVLSPVIRHPIPRSVLEQLEIRFHQLILADIAFHELSRYVVLPPLDALTELESPEMRFSTAWLYGGPAEDKGYRFRLDRRELLVCSYGIAEAGGSRYFRITENEVKEIEQAVAFKPQMI